MNSGPQYCLSQPPWLELDKGRHALQRTCPSAVTTSYGTMGTNETLWLLCCCKAWGAVYHLCTYNTSMLPIKPAVRMVMTPTTTVSIFFPLSDGGKWGWQSWPRTHRAFVPASSSVSDTILSVGRLSTCWLEARDTLILTIILNQSNLQFEI